MTSPERDDPPAGSGEPTDAADVRGPDPAHPLGRPEAPDSAAERSSDESDPDTSHAVMRERGPGAHAEKLSDEATFREDETAPGVDPTSGDA